VPLDVAVQVVNYRTRRQLEVCLPSVLADVAELDSRVLVLDNASGDDLSALAAAHPDVEFVDSERNVGFGAGHNLLAARHDAPALLILNPDTEIVEPRTVARLLEALRDGVAAVGPQLVSASGAVDPRDHGELHAVPGCQAMVLTRPRRRPAQESRIEEASAPARA